MLYFIQTVLHSLIMAIIAETGCRTVICTHGAANMVTLPIICADFNCKLQDVEGGDKLALIYRLVQRSAGPLPVFQDISDITYEVEEELEAWEAGKLLPKRAFHILDNEYVKTRKHVQGLV